MGQAAFVADAADIGQNGNSNASISSKDPDTAVTHFAGDHILTLLEFSKPAFLPAMCLMGIQGALHVAMHKSPDSKVSVAILGACSS